MAEHRGAQIFQKSRNHLKILGSRKVTCSKLQTKDPQTLGATVKCSRHDNLAPQVGATLTGFRLNGGHPYVLAAFPPRTQACGTHYGKDGLTPEHF
jgi:hypothetical protein